MATGSRCGDGLRLPCPTLLTTSSFLTRSNQARAQAPSVTSHLALWRQSAGARIARGVFAREYPYGSAVIWVLRATNKCRGNRKRSRLLPTASSGAYVLSRNRDELGLEARRASAKAQVEALIDPDTVVP